MSRDNINVHYPEIEQTQLIADKKISKKAVVQTNGIAIQKAFDNKNNSLMICVENTSSSASQVTFKAGDNYPNATLGDLVLDIDATSTVCYQVQDPSRFENKDGSVCLDFKTGFTGNIYAVAKSVAIH